MGLCCFARVLLAWGALYRAKNHMAKAHGTTFVPFYSAKKENVSEKRSKVVQPQSKSANSRISIQKGTRWRDLSANFFHCGAARNLIAKGSRVAQPSCHLIV